MKLYLKYLFGLPLVAMLLFCFAVNVWAQTDPTPAGESISYRLYKDGDGYRICADTDGAEISPLYATAQEAIADIPTSEISAHLRFEALEICEPLTLSRSLVLTGDVHFYAPLTVQSGASLIFADGEYTLEHPIRLRDGSITVDGGRIVCADKGAVLMEYSSRASLHVKDGSISSDGLIPTVTVHMGSLIVTGGEICNTAGAAVRTTVGMTLSGAPILRGVGCDVSASRPIELSYMGTAFSGSLTLRTDSLYEKGSATVLAYGAQESSPRSITVLDAEGNAVPSRYFHTSDFCEQNDILAAYVPFEIRYFADGKLFATAYYLAGQKVDLPTAPEKKGYRFIQYSSEENGAPIVSVRASSDMILTAQYRLLAPTFSISSLSFCYDGTSHAWSPSAVEHPLLEEGSCSWSWYREGVLLAESSSTLQRTYVSESGNYRLALTFTHKGESVTVESAPLTLTVRRRIIVPPTVASAIYNGLLQIASITPSLDYTVSENMGGIHRGIYPVTLLLSDPENTRWQTSESESCTLNFEILQSENSWISYPAISDFYESAAPSYSAMARYGEVTFLFAPIGSDRYLPDLPSDVGTYHMIARVVGTDDYRTLQSDPIPFSVLENKIVSIRIINEPYCLQYVAFSSFDSTGMRLSATYSDGTVKEILSSLCEIVYPSGGTYFSSSDTYVTLRIADVEAVQAVRVARAEYDISTILFSDRTSTFTGSYQTIEPSGDFPIGLDGIPLAFSVSGGGIHSGTYTVTLTFESESDEYALPDSIYRTLTVVPMAVTLEWGASAFVYNGTPQVPAVSFVDLFGVRRFLSVEGVAVRAGEGYLATAILNDADYRADNPTTVFSIARATYDLSSVCWQGGSYFYDGTPKSVVLSGLPDGVSVASYTDANAINAGTYHAAVTLFYDSENYNHPSIPSYEWYIRPATYATEGYSFLGGSLVYNGEVQYPTLCGAMPIGADGSSPTFSFDRGVRDVIEGCVEITVCFSSCSRNYLAPDPITVSLSILPMRLEVSWTQLSFVYDGAPHLPTAFSPHCDLAVSGSAVSAGDYVAVCSSRDPNYTVANDRVAFSVLRAENRWISPLSVSNVYTSGRVSPSATPLVGTVTYRYFLDRDATQEIEIPSLAGTYFVRAEVAQSENYLALVSSLCSFSILQVCPTELSVSVLRSELYAFETLSPSDLSVRVLCNDGSSYLAPDYTVLYMTADSLRACDRSIRITAEGISHTVPITVYRAMPDLSSLSLKENTFVYSGLPVNPIIVGLPSGFTVASVSGGGAIAAGEYTLALTLAYDRENYEEIGTISIPYTVSRRQVALPQLETLVYNGREQSPTLPVSPDYTAVGIQRGTGAGIYSVFFSLTDIKNTVFEATQTDTCEVQYRILPLTLTVQMSDIIRYRDRTVGEITYTVMDGIILQGDTLSYTPILDTTVDAQFNNPNYDVQVLPGTLTDTNRLSPEGRQRVVLLVLWVIPLALLLIVVLIFGRPLLVYLRRRALVCESAAPMSDVNEPLAIIADETAASSADTQDEKLHGASYDENKESADIHRLVQTDKELLTPNTAWPAPIDIYLSDAQQKMDADTDISSTTDGVFADISESKEENEACNVENGKDSPTESEFTEGEASESFPLKTDPSQTSKSPEISQDENLCIEENNSENQNEFPTNNENNFGFEECEQEKEQKTSNIPPLYDNFTSELSVEKNESADELLDLETYSPFAMTAEKADGLMADMGAKDLLTHEGTIETYGRRRSIINIDTLSENFQSGDCVDVNILKQRYLIPYDTGYLKVLARGCIDKALTVYANDFSLTAVKMLLLSGGKAVKIATTPTKKRKDPLAK